MVGITEIGAAIGGLKGAMDIAKGINAGASAVALNDAKITLQSAILDAQSSLLAAQEAEAAHLGRISNLEQEIVRLKDWSGERERYYLVDVYRGAMAYMPKPGMENGQPAHWLCANCFEQGRKSFLQFKGQGVSAGGSRSNESGYGCDACKASIRVFYRTKPRWPGEPEEQA